MKHGLAILVIQVALMAGTAAVQELQATASHSSATKGTEANQNATIVE